MSVSANVAVPCETEMDREPFDQARPGSQMDVRIESVSKAFGDTPALYEVSLTIRAGELIALLGPSGSGKTTLLRILGGLEFPSSGRVLFGEEDALQHPVRERNVGFVFQQYALFRHMRVFENIAFGLRVRRRRNRPSKADIRGRVTELLDLVQLAGLEKRFPSQLSGGQRQRVALARALAIRPRILLLDEPFGALDAKVRKELRRGLRDIHDKTGHTTVFVTHDQEEALELADRVVVMNQGRIEQIGAPSEVYDTPATPFVFSFIGESSALPVAIRAGTLLLDGQPLALAAPDLPDGPARLYFRPHDAEIVPGPMGAILGSVLSVRRHGGARRVELQVGDGHRIEIEIPPADMREIPDRLAIRPRRWKVFPTSA